METINLIVVWGIIILLFGMEYILIKGIYTEIIKPWFKRGK